MFCPKTNEFCKYDDCPSYLNAGRDYCVDVLYMKLQLGILTQGEKKALAQIRKKESGCRLNHTYLIRVVPQRNY